MISAIFVTRDAENVFSLVNVDGQHHCLDLKRARGRLV